jgi:hypothetical protein
MMIWLVAQMKWIMLVSGTLTCTMLYAFVAPDAAVRSTFGEPIVGPAADIVVRNWGALIGLVGAMLIYGAFVPASRPLVLTVAGLSKLTFIALILAGGRQFLANQAGLAVVADLTMVLLFAAYLVGARRIRQ